MWFYSTLLIPTLLEALGCLASLHSQSFSFIRSLFDGVAFPILHILLVTVENLTCLRKITPLPPLGKTTQNTVEEEKQKTLFALSFSICFVEMQDRYLI